MKKSAKSSRVSRSMMNHRNVVMLGALLCFQSTFISSFMIRKSFDGHIFRSWHRLPVRPTNKELEHLDKAQAFLNFIDNLKLNEGLVLLPSDSVLSTTTRSLDPHSSDWITNTNIGADDSTDGRYQPATKPKRAPLRNSPLFSSQSTAELDSQNGQYYPEDAKVDHRSEGKAEPNLQHTHPLEQDSIERFAADITTVLKGQRAAGQDPSLPKLFRSIKMPSFTNIWSNRDWDMHTSRWRHLKYLLALPTSRLLRRLAPQLAILFVWSCTACWMCSKEFQGILSRAVLPLTPLSLVSTFVAGLLTLRSNQGLSRLNEGRLAFGKVVLYTRDMAQLIATVVYPRNAQLGLLAARHVALFGWLLKDFLRNYDEDYTRPLHPYLPSPCHEQDIVQTMLPSLHLGDSGASARFILEQRKKPVAVCTRLRQIFGYLHLDLTTSEQSRLDACAQQLNKCISVCERIRASPIPPLYTAHAGRLLSFYLFFLPLALRGSSLLNNVGTVLTTTVVGYAMLGLDEISHVLEQPFRLMPLYHLSKDSMKDVADAIVCMPPPLPVDIVQNDKLNETEYFVRATTAEKRRANTEVNIPSYW